MNKWKVAFFALAGTVLFAILLVVFLATRPVDDVNVAKSSAGESESKGNVLVVQTTTKELESISKKYLKDAAKGSPLPLDFTIGDDIQLRSTLTVFYTEIPISMNFDPIVDEKGNIILKQTGMNVGLLNIPPETTMKIMRDSVEFPSWITVNPNKAEIYIDLSRINIASGSRVRAKELDLPKDKILLEIIVPGE
ncbi:YpmS family protein [Lysinibacillus irui]|uniref:YpmS family protein n=1 Tax=Lysinibacillus irui TaxID=2998077 RepID=A0AAJ5RP63_9BACI|nr:MULTISPECIES: YpmS family protein [Lysinibacillus]MEA0553253.1 YpmS family protein [Lysinibacillus irui]MEA0562487.1 YpmS family protein [Lysinibacillus irui]MEA0978987.1 YpmS family protein [Lysinibacillus irui]MEA1045141.1 YpmS family protein [Lysinibacillus irui]WDV08858.1 YpmS family protein [Lysinibacillus irui]